MPQQPEQGNNYTKKIGSTMTLLAWVIFLGILTLLFSGFIEQQNNPNSDVKSQVSNGVIEVILEQNRAGHYIANAKINTIPVDVIIDTGASEVSIPAGIAEKMGLIRGPAMEVITANGTIQVYITKIDTMEIGEITLHNIRANINPYVTDDFVLLGMSFLEKLEFTQSQGIMRLRQ